MRFIVGRVPKELGVILVPFDRVEVAILQVVFTDQSRRLEHISHWGHLQTHQPQTSRSCREENEESVKWNFHIPSTLASSEARVKGVPVCFKRQEIMGGNTSSVPYDMTKVIMTALCVLVVRVHG
jgi:hypothetical protein